MSMCCWAVLEWLGCFVYVIGVTTDGVTRVALAFVACAAGLAAVCVTQGLRPCYTAAG